MKKIFIADDDEELLELMTRLFSRDYEVYSCARAGNIYGEVYGFAPDLIIIDNTLGNTSSETIIKEFRKIDPAFSIPFLLVSAHPSISEIAIKIGANGYVEKPFDVTYIRYYVKDIFKK